MTNSEEIKPVVTLSMSSMLGCRHQLLSYLVSKSVNIKFYLNKFFLLIVGLL